MTRLSVVLCTRNPRPDCMRRVLESLCEQSLEKKHWELLIVDNGSDRRIADEWNLSKHLRHRHIREDTLGLLPARLRGIREAQGGLLVFVDDDTVIDVDYLSHARSIHAQHTHLGAFGAGILEPEFEVAPPSELLPRIELLGIRTVNVQVFCSNPRDASFRPRGGGLCVTREVADTYDRLVDRLGVIDIIGRHGRALFSGDDDLFAWAAASMGTVFGLFPELRVTHLIAAERMTREYFVRLIHDHTFSHSILRHLLTGARPRRLTLSKRILALAHGLKNGRFSMQCRVAELRGENNASYYTAERQLRPLEKASQAVTFSVDCTSHNSSLEDIGGETRTSRNR